MKKILLALSIVVISFGSATAQDAASGFHFAGGVRLAMPLGDFKDFQGIGLGVELQGENHFSDNVSGLISAGYTTFSGKNFTVGGVNYEGSSFGIIPLLVGVRVYPSPQFFIGAKAGVAIGTSKGSGSNFNYEPQIGFNGQKVQVSLGYNAISGDGGSLRSIGASFLYKFN